MADKNDKHHFIKDNALTLGMDTLAVRAGIASTTEGEHSEPIFMTSSFVFDSAEQAAARFSGEEEGKVQKTLSQHHRGWRPFSVLSLHYWNPEIILFVLEVFLVPPVCFLRNIYQSLVLILVLLH
jgi:hypothetical protein